MTTARNRVRLGDLNIEYEVRRSARRKKTVQTTVKDGRVLVSAPVAVKDAEIEAIIRKQATWIFERQSEVAPPMPPLKFVTGAEFPYLGQAIRMEITERDIPSPMLRFGRRRFQVAVPFNTDDGQTQEQIRAALSAWYRGRASEKLPVLVEQWSHSFHYLEPPPVLIGSQRSFWGSCSPKGVLRFSWRVMMLEPSLIEYIVVHELAHLKIMDHSKGFWNFVASVLPDVQLRRRRLKTTEKGLPL
jgi:predicted metal-dependent hydrolase